MRTRFAPSPTGDLHVGGAWTALAAWALARAHGGRFIVRVEDIDTPRVVAGSEARIVEDLGWLGLDWDESPTRQSNRTPRYEAALARLERDGLTYPCDCSRAEIARAASAPHAGEDSVYPGTCRDAPRTRVLKRAPAIRLRVPPGSRIAFVDGLHGPVVEDVATSVGDFVLRRADGVFAYQLVVAYDDAEMGITHVVRADDLLSSTARQILLLGLLGFRQVPAYTHVPLVVRADGERLAKRTKGLTLRELAERGISADAVVAQLSGGLGLAAYATSPRDVAARLRPVSSWRREPWPVPW